MTLAVFVGNTEGNGFYAHLRQLKLFGDPFSKLEFVLQYITTSMDSNFLGKLLFKPILGRFVYP